MLMPIFKTVSAATAGRAIKPPAAAAAMPLSTVLRNMTFPPIVFPSPLWGGVGVGVERSSANVNDSAKPPTPTPPSPQGGGRSISHPFEMRNLRALALRLAGDRRPRQARLAIFHDEGVCERIPRRLDVGRAGARRVVAHIVADEMAGDAELRVGFEILVLE